MSGEAKPVPEGDAASSISVAFVSQYFFPEQFSLNAMAEDLVLRGHKLTVLTGVPNYGLESFFDGYSNRKRRDEDWRGARVLRAWSVSRGKSRLRLLLNYLTFPITGTWMAYRRFRQRPDVIFVSLLSPIFQAVPAIFLSWYHRVPLVYWVQDIWPESAIHTLRLRNRFAISGLNAVCRWIFRRADLVLVQSEAFPPMVTRYGVPADQIRVLPNTAPQMYQPLNASSAPQICDLMPKAEFTLMFGGNIGESQDFDMLLEVACLLRDCEVLHWVIIGSGRDLNRVRAKVAELGLEDRFHLLGRYYEEDMPRFFAQADALIVSLRENDIFNLTVPYKIQCYMACGKPILAAIAGEGARVIRQSAGGIVVNPSQPAEMAEAIHRFMDLSPDARKNMGRQARSYFDRHYMSDVVYGNLERWLLEAAQLPYRQSR